MSQISLYSEHKPFIIASHELYLAINEGKESYFYKWKLKNIIYNLSLEEGVDYIIINSIKPVGKRGPAPKRVLLTKQTAFALCVMNNSISGNEFKKIIF